MSIVLSIASQYQAAFEMLKQVLTTCPDPVWNDPADANPVWRVAYHALFYTHLYLQETAEAFTPWAQHQPEQHALQQPPAEVAPYTRAALLEYLAFCQQEAAARVAALDPEAPSGFSWLPFSKLELQFYNLRHLQHHIGELMERVGARAQLTFHWVGAAPGP